VRTAITETLPDAFEDFKSSLDLVLQALSNVFDNPLAGIAQFSAGVSGFLTAQRGWQMGTSALLSALDFDIEIPAAQDFSLFKTVKLAMKTAVNNLCVTIILLSQPPLVRALCEIGLRSIDVLLILIVRIP